MAKKVKMLENKISGSTEDLDAAQHVGPSATAVAPAVVPVAIPYGGDIPTTKADHPPYQPTYNPGDDDDETSFSNSRPPTSSSYHGARPKTGKAADDSQAPDGHRPSLALPSITE